MLLIYTYIYIYVICLYSLYINIQMLKIISIEVWFHLYVKFYTCNVKTNKNYK